MQQQILDLFEFKPTFSNFIPINNEMLCANLQSFSSQFTHIVGANKTGKTHLLTAWVNLAHNEKKSALYFDCAQSDINKQIQEIDLNVIRFIALDNIEKLDNDGQIALFDLFNHIKLNNRANYLLTSSTTSLNQLNLREDLKTRLLSGINLHLHFLNDDELLSALRIYVKKEGINFDDSEIIYLINHYERNMGKLIKIINKIAKYAVTQKKSISTGLIRQVIATVV